MLYQEINNCYFKDSDMFYFLCFKWGSQALKATHSRHCSNSRDRVIWLTMTEENVTMTEINDTECLVKWVHWLFSIVKASSVHLNSANCCQLWGLRTVLNAWKLELRNYWASWLGGHAFESFGQWLWAQFVHWVFVIYKFPTSMIILHCVGDWFSSRTGLIAACWL